MAVEWVYRNAARDGDGATVQKQTPVSALTL
eukprot:SAG11_NODE_10854_length_801_cov_0.915954_2_plen_30_part_01